MVLRPDTRSRRPRRVDELLRPAPQRGTLIDEAAPAEGEPSDGAGPGMSPDEESTVEGAV